MNNSHFYEIGEKYAEKLQKFAKYRKIYKY